MVSSEGGQVHVYESEGVEYLDQRLYRDLDMCQTLLSQTAGLTVGRNLTHESPERAAQ